MYLHYRVLFIYLFGRTRLCHRKRCLSGDFFKKPPPNAFLCHTKEDRGQGVSWLVIGLKNPSTFEAISLEGMAALIHCLTHRAVDSALIVWLTHSQSCQGKLDTERGELTRGYFLFIPLSPNQSRPL